MRDMEKAYKRRALRDLNQQSYVSVAPARQITKISKAVTYLTLRSLKLRAIA
jgi:radical SAM superfamily enzyme